jgi:elongation factor 1-gamma
VAAKANGLELELVPTENDVNAVANKSAEYRKLNPQGKIPTFVGANGFVLTEAFAIAIYGMSI